MNTLDSVDVAELPKYVEKRRKVVNTIDSIRLVNLPNFVEDNGKLVVVESNKNIPMSIKRIFYVYGSSGDIRGQHAHKELTQILICINGACIVNCEDGDDRSTYVLNNSAQGLVVPPGIWAEQIYEQRDTILLVLCDKEYNESEYIREYDKYLEFLKL